MSQDTRQGTVVEPIPSVDPESMDAVFQALADVSRRVAIEYLTASDRPVSRDELVQHVATAANDGTSPGGTQHDEIAVRFHHRHLPKLTEAGLVDYDRERDVLYATRTADAIARCLERR